MDTSLESDQHFAVWHNRAMYSTLFTSLNYCTWKVLTVRSLPLKSTNKIMMMNPFIIQDHYFAIPID